MRVLIFGERRTKLVRTSNEWTGEIVTAVVGGGIGLFDREYDQRSDGTSRLLGQAPQALIEWAGKIDCSADWHDMILS
jgi:hypothetical protein